MASLRFPFWVALTSAALVAGLLLAGTVLARTAYAAQHPDKPAGVERTHGDCPWGAFWGGKPTVEPGQGGA